MKKIRFGSFPLISLPARERQCLDSYLIKSFADKIAISSTLGTISRTERVYITPNLIRKYFKDELYESDLSVVASDMLLEEAKGGAPKKPTTPTTPQDKNKDKDKRDNSFGDKPLSEQARIKRAFQALKNLNANIIKDPFYQHNINFPIYIENMDANGIPTSYDFLLLTNDLLNKSSINEINYSDNITLIIMFMKIILSPNLRLSDLGNPVFKADSDLFRSDIVKFIEFAQQKGTNPISLMFMLLISVAKAKKMHTGPGPFNGLIKSTQNYIKNVFGTKLGETTKFFDDKYPHTKSISFLLNGVDFDGIQKFFDDTMSVPTHIAGTPHEAQYTSNKDNETGVFADPVFRQFMMQKTEQYNSVLSLVNAMYDFNADNNLYRDVESSDSLILKFNDGNTETAFNINQDEIISLMDNEAMPCFMTNLRNDINNELNRAYLVFGTSLKTRMKGKVEARDKGDYKMSSDMIQKEVQTLESKLATATPDQAQSINNSINSLYKKLQSNFIFQAYGDQIDPKKQVKVINLEFNLRNIQSELTYLYSNAIMKLVDENTLSSLISKDSTITTSVIDSLQNNFDQIAISITDGIKSQLKQSLMGTVQDIEANLHSLNIEFDPTDLIKYLNDIEMIIDKYQFSSINDKIRTNFISCILNKVSTYFGSQSRIQLSVIKNAMAEKNPILKKLSNTNDVKKFKSFIVTEKIMIDLYNMVYFYDTQRYIGGLINTPPSTKIFNEQNQIRYMLKRIGLENNIVYVIGTSGVTLQMPDFLSLTGSPLFEKISMAELRSRCQVQWEQQMWTDPKFGAEIKSIGGNSKEIQKKLDAAQKQLTDTLNKLKNTTDSNQQQKLNTIIDNLKQQIEKHNNDLNNAKGAQKNTGIENLTIPHKLPETMVGPKFDDEFSNGNNYQQGNPGNQGHGFPRPLNSDIPNIMSGINSMSGNGLNSNPGNQNIGYERDRNQERNQYDRNNTNPNQNGYYGKPPYRPN